MDYIKFFKSEAKKFYKDFQTQYVVENDDIYSYRPKFWKDIDDIIVSFDIDEDDFSLMKAQHIVAYLANFKSWNELLYANEYQLELGYYLLKHRENNLLEDWRWYESYAKISGLDDSSKLDIFKIVYLENLE
ncbi:MAG: hypothetical protein E7198_07115 [Schwartzia succinivorans]|uniref:hypothetical protein n=1 Tax=Schwartzia succinivorans TaxID=55507 RepID=UPI0023561FD5|nr:hypothetical protein [Schwartzia succinivorans]MBE6097553.1 hypothetical protein [Schwartzia succinivorans]